MVLRGFWWCLDCVSRSSVQAPPETSQHHAKHKAYSSATLPIYCFHSPRTGISCDPTPIAFCCACHAIVLPYMLQDQLRPYPPHRGRVTTDPEEVGSQPTPLPLNFGDLHVCNLWDPKKTPFSFRFQNLLLENVEKYLIHLETFQCFFQIVHLKS